MLYGSKQWVRLPEIYIELNGVGGTGEGIASFTDFTEIVRVPNENKEPPRASILHFLKKYINSQTLLQRTSQLFQDCYRYCLSASTYLNIITFQEFLNISRIHSSQAMNVGEKTV